MEQHHEHAKGTEFPAGLRAPAITPLSSLFILAHDMVDYYIEHNGKVDVEEFLCGDFDKYNAGNFKKVMKAIAKIAL